MVSNGQQKMLPFSILAMLLFASPNFLYPSSSLGQSGGVQLSLSDQPDSHFKHSVTGQVATRPTYNLPDLGIENLDSLIATGSPPPPRKGRYCEDDSVRSGCPHIVSPFATFSINCDDYSLGRIGGGTLLGGESACRTHDGTWAIDYTGRWIPRYVFLPWSHGLRYQGGYGAYETEAPFNPHTRHSHE
jgi:hypothetical protein